MATGNWLEGWMKAHVVNKRRNTNIFIAAFIVSIATPVIYLTAWKSAYIELNRRLQSKVETIADTNQNGSLSLDEMVGIYRIIGKNPEEELKDRGLNLRIEESQQYLRNMGKFNPETDIYCFWDGL